MILQKNELKEIGIQEYGMISTAEIPFEQEIRKICEGNACRLYAKTWACPPAVGTIEECQERCLQYKTAMVFSAVYPLEDSFDFDGMEAGKARHTQLCPAIVKLFQEQYEDLLILSAEGCGRCQTCTYPDAPCRFPDTLYPSIESYGVEVNRLAAKAGVNYINGANTVTYFGCIAY